MVIFHSYVAVYQRVITSKAFLKPSRTGCPRALWNWAVPQLHLHLQIGLPPIGIPCPNLWGLKFHSDHHCSPMPMVCNVDAKSYAWNPINNGMFTTYQQDQQVQDFAGPSTVWHPVPNSDRHDTQISLPPGWHTTKTLTLWWHFSHPKHQMTQWWQSNCINM